MYGTCSPAYLCTGEVGYDGPTGLGSPNGVAAFSTGPHGQITGRVTDASTSAPIIGAQVTAGDATTITDTAGHYQLTAPVGTTDVSASAYGFGSAKDRKSVV